MPMRDITSTLPLVVENLSYHIDGKALLDSVTMTLPKSGISAVIGPNGAGKSLLLRLCHGLLRPTGGTIRWQQAPEDSRKKRHGMVFQRPVMLRRSAKDNILHALVAIGAPDPKERAEVTLQKFGLDALAERPARLLSGGEQQRLAIARAWALEPELLLLDEPTSQLDPGATRQIEDMIQTLAAEGMTILMATHDLGQAQRLSRRVLFLNRGRLVEDAPTAQFFSAPETAEARHFIAGELLW
jgi:tungstate transport system ATP-binding protein